MNSRDSAYEAAIAASLADAGLAEGADGAGLLETGDDAGGCRLLVNHACTY